MSKAAAPSAGNNVAKEYINIIYNDLHHTTQQNMTGRYTWFMKKANVWT
jgi:hypothetical protein